MNKVLPCCHPLHLEGGGLVASEFANVDQLLQSLRGEAALHSTSRFSLDLAARARKLQTYQAAEPSLFYLKWAQAGIASGASRLNFRLSYQRTELEFEVPHDLDTSHWFSDEPQSEWVEFLRIAVEAALCDSPIGLSLDLGHRQLLGWGEVAERGLTPPGMLRLATFSPRRPWYKRFAVNPRLAQVHREVSGRLALAPVAVSLDGRLVNCANPDFDERWGRPAWVSLATPARWMIESVEPTVGQPCFLVGSPWLLPARLTLVGKEEIWRSSGQFTTLSRRLHVDDKLLRTQKAEQPPIPHFWQQATGRLPGAEMECDFLQEVPLSLVTNKGVADIWFYHEARLLQGMADYLEPNLPSPLPHCQGMALPALRMERWLGLPSQPGGQSRLYYVQHGLLLEPIEISTRVPGTVAIIARENVQTDLSQMRPVEDEQFKLDLEWVNTTVEALIADISLLLRDSRRCERLAIDPAARNIWLHYPPRR